MSEVTTTKQNVQTASTVKKITATAVMAALTTLMTAYIFHNRSTAKEVCQAVDSVSISLNMPDAASYNEAVAILKNNIGIQTLRKTAPK